LVSQLALAGFFLLNQLISSTRCRRVATIGKPADDRSIAMEKIDVFDASHAVSSMQALRTAMIVELDDMEHRIEQLSGLPVTGPGDDELAVYYVARAALYSGLASITEVLGWVCLMAEKDSEGNIPKEVKSLTTVPVFSIH
jgi:hypothetical protein